MKALLSIAPGAADKLVLSDVADPAPKAGEVVVEVAACGLNYPDTLIIEDRYQVKPPRPFSPGCEVAGSVVAVGDGVKWPRVGDRVIGSTSFGGMAEKAVVEASRCLPVPPSMPLDEAAAFALTYGTSHYALHHRGNLKAGESLLVLGAAGGVGIAAVQLGKAAGARVVAAVSSEAKAQFALEHGADGAAIYPRGAIDKDGSRALAQLFKDAGGANGFDVVYDAVGGSYTEAALRSMNWGGRLLVVGFPAGIPAIPLNLPLLKTTSIVGVFWGNWVDKFPDQFHASMDELGRLYQEGLIRPIVTARFPLAEGGHGLDWLKSRRAMGKGIVVINERV